MTQNQRIQIGEGRISGYLSIFFALICFLGVVCAFFPEYLTTADFREAYNPLFIKWSLLVVALFSLGFAITSLILSTRTTWGFIGITILITSIILGNYLPESDGIESNAYTLGLEIGRAHV